MLPVLVLSVILNFFLNMGNVAESKDDVWGFEKIVDWQVEFHGVPWEPDFVMVEDAEYGINKAHKSIMALVWEVSNDTMNDSFNDEFGIC